MSCCSGEESEGDMGAVGETEGGEDEGGGDGEVVRGGAGKSDVVIAA